MAFCTRKKALFPCASDGFLSPSPMTNAREGGYHRKAGLYDVQRCKQGSGLVKDDASMNAPSAIGARLRSLGICRRRPLTVTSLYFM